MTETLVPDTPLFRSSGSIPSLRNPVLAATAAAARTLTGGANGGCGGGYGRGYDNGGNVLRDKDQIYRDARGNYYCKKPDGTTGLIVGGLAGGVLGNVIAPGGSKTLGTILGAAGGALAGRAIDRNNVRCE